MDPIRGWEGWGLAISGEVEYMDPEDPEYVSGSDSDFDTKSSGKW